MAASAREACMHSSPPPNMMSQSHMYKSMFVADIALLGTLKG